MLRYTFILFTGLLGLCGAACCAIIPLQKPAPAPVCETSKITFTQATGCLNDGSVEFCIPADDPAALAAVREIAPDVQCMPSMGRARCDLDTQVLCMVETRGWCEPDDPPAMTDSGWQMTCELASLPFITAIVPTWYE